MARPLRVEYPGALYHIMSRGNRYQNIFKDDQDRSKFLDWLTDAVKVHNLICHAYCLMSNHYHLLLETPDANLSRAMRDLNGHYTQSFNKKHKTVGHLFQGRYKALVVEKETYLLELARYIVLNPVRARLVKHPRHYRWSSYRATAEYHQTLDYVFTDWILGHFGKQKSRARIGYREFIKEGISADDPHREIQNGFLLGSPQFIHWIWETQTNGSEDLKLHSREERIVGRLTLKEIFAHVVTKEERDEAIRFARFRCGYLNTEIGKHLGLHWTTIGQISRR